MKVTIIILVILLLIIIYFSNKNKNTNTNTNINTNINTFLNNKIIEKFISSEEIGEEDNMYNADNYVEDKYDNTIFVDTFSFDSLPKFNYYNSEGLNHILNICGDASGTIFNNIFISKNFKVRGKDIKNYSVNAIYPIGSFYVQYPDKNTNTETEAFPESLSPASLYGGTWEEQWNSESIFFRTRSVGGVTADQDRRNGLQDFAIKKIEGQTQYTQGDRDYIKYNSNTNPKGSGLFEATFGEVRTDDNKAGKTGIFNRLDNGFQSLVSDNELRVRNRLCKVWKRVPGENDIVYEKTGKIIS